MEVNHVFSDDSHQQKAHKKSFWMGDSRLKMCTIQSFKGWELYNVVLIIPSDALLLEDDKTLESDKDRLIYTAITRMKCNLVIINYDQKYKQFGELYKKKWDEQ